MKQDPKVLKNRAAAHKNKAAEDEETRRHSMFPKEQGLSKEKGKYDADLQKRKETNGPKTGKLNKVQYRVKNEIFVLYDYYHPVKIIGSGAYAVVWYVLFRFLCVFMSCLLLFGTLKKKETFSFALFLFFFGLD